MTQFTTGLPLLIDRGVERRLAIISAFSLEIDREANELTAKVIEEIIRRAPEMVAQALGEHENEVRKIAEKV